MNPWLELEEHAMNPDGYRRGFKTVEGWGGDKMPPIFYTQHYTWKPTNVHITTTTKSAAENQIEAIMRTIPARMRLVHDEGYYRLTREQRLAGQELTEAQKKGQKELDQWIKWRERRGPNHIPWC